MNYKHAQIFGLVGATLGIGGPIAARFAKKAGYGAFYELLLFGTIFLGAFCIIGAVISYRLAQDKLKRDLKGDVD